MRTVECLRGRLLAERVASKAAKEEAYELEERLAELEKKLSDEVKMRNKAERRLRRAVKKLESVKILDARLSAESSTGSLSSNCCSGQQAPQMDSPGSLSVVDSSPLGGGGEDKGWHGDSAGGSSAGSCSQVSWSSVVSEQSGSGSGLCKEENRMDPGETKNCVHGEDDAGGDDHGSEREQVEKQPAASNVSSKSSEIYRRDGDEDRLALVPVDYRYHSAGAGGPRAEYDDDDAGAARLREEDSNELAIVLADPQPPPRRPSEAHGGNDVESVLLALRHVKEQLRFTIEKRSGELVAHRELYGY